MFNPIKLLACRLVKPIMYWRSFSITFQRQLQNVVFEVFWNVDKMCVSLTALMLDDTWWAIKSQAKSSYFKCLIIWAEWHTASVIFSYVIHFVWIRLLKQINWLLTYLRNIGNYATIRAVEGRPLDIFLWMADELSTTTEIAWLTKATIKPSTN